MAMKLTVVCVISKKNESKLILKTSTAARFQDVAFHIPLPSLEPTHPPAKYPAVVGGHSPLVITPTGTADTDQAEPLESLKLSKGFFAH